LITFNPNKEGFGYLFSWIVAKYMKDKRRWRKRNIEAMGEPFTLKGIFDIAMGPASPSTL